MFVTLFLGILDVDTGHLLYCNAGHNLPLLSDTDGTVRELKGTHGTPLGAMPDINYGCDELYLNDRESLLLYTDGVSEAIDTNDNQYTEKRLIDKFAEISSREPASIIGEIIKDHDNFVGDADQFDDITMLVISWFDTGKQK
jgi:sigma-B regulation protein RsbU (phosphoserine phosphatase)